MVMADPKRCPECGTIGNQHMSLCSVYVPSFANTADLGGVTPPGITATFIAEEDAQDWTLHNLMEQLMEDATDSELAAPFEQRLAGLIAAHAIEREHARNFRGNRPLAEHFWERVDKTSGECWLWTGPKQIWVKERGVLAIPQRVAWFLFSGDWIEGLAFVRVCRTKLCVRPEHFELQQRGVVKQAAVREQIRELDRQLAEPPQRKR